MKKQKIIEIIDLGFEEQDIISTKVTKSGIYFTVRIPIRADDYPQEQKMDDSMRVFVNKIIDRVFQDRQQGIYH